MKKVAAFTILELLVSMAVLAIILVMLLQVVNGLLQSTRTQSQQMDSVASARRALDVMASDLQNAVIGDNSAILVPTAVGGNLFALLAARRGPSDTTNRFLAIKYSTNASNQLVRSYGAVDFNQTDLLGAAINTTNTPVEPLAKGILAVQVLAIAEATNYLLPTTYTANWATNTYNGLTNVPGNWQALITRSPAFASSLTNRTRALEVWIAAVDDQNFQILKDSSKLSVAQGLLASAPTTWRSNLDYSAIPNQTKSGIRILNKTIALP
jgi:type II secretory pathway pseudopilin PulG